MRVKIYVLKHPETYEIRYIGRTKNSLNVRLNGHISKAKTNIRKTHKDNWILSLNTKPIIELIDEVEGWSESYLREQQLISEYLKKDIRLVNLHDRGEGGLLRIISKKQRKKISKKIKQLHREGKLNCGRKKITLFNLNGEKIKTFNSYKECANYLKVSEKHLQNSIRRNAGRIKNYQHKIGEITNDIPPYINPRITYNARLKLGELLETPEMKLDEK